MATTIPQAEANLARARARKKRGIKRAERNFVRARAAALRDDLIALGLIAVTPPNCTKVRQYVRRAHSEPALQEQLL